MNDAVSRPPASERTAPNFMFDPAAFSGLYFRRFIAYVIDLVVVAALLFVGFILSLVLTFLTLGLAAPLIGVLGTAIFFGYFTFMLGGPESATIGMRHQGIEMRTWDGKRPNYLQALFHTFLFYIVVGITSVVFIIVPLFNIRRRNIHDFFSGAVFMNKGHLKD